MLENKWNLVGPMSGVAFATLVIVGAGIAGSPDVEPSHVVGLRFRQ